MYVLCLAVRLFLKLGILTLTSTYNFELSKFVKQRPDLFRRAIDLNPRNTRKPHGLVLEYCTQIALFQRNCYNMGIKIKYRTI